MAIKYLDAKRIRGNYVAASPASDWTVASDNAEYVLTGNQINFALIRDGENGTAVVDLGAGTISDTWVLRMHVNFTGNSSGDSYAYQSFWGLSDLPLAQNWGDAQDSAGFVIHFAGTGGSGDNRFAVVETDGNSGFEDSSVSYSGLTVTPTGEWWVELKRINSTTITLGVYTDATYGTLVSGTSVTSNTNFSGTGLRYLKLAVPNYSTQSEIQNGTLNEIEFYDNMTTASGTPLKFLTAAEDDKATFFAVDTSATADLTSTFTCSASGTTSNCGGWNFRRNNSNSTTDQMHVTLKRSGSTYLSVYDLVTNGIISSPISTESFVLRFSFTPRSNSWDSGASRNLWVGLTDNGGTGDSDGANNSQDFVGMEINGSTSGTGKYSGIGGSSINLTTVADTTSQISLSGDCDYSTPTTYYFEIIKSGGNVQVKRYTNSNYNTEVSSSATTSVSANSPTGLRYIKFMTWDQSSTDGEMEANVPKVEFWKETTNLPENTLFEETDVKTFANSQSNAGIETYWLQDSEWKKGYDTLVLDHSSSTGNQNSLDDRTALGEKILSGNSLIGKKVKSIKVKLKVGAGSPAGDIVMNVVNNASGGSYGTVKHTFGTALGASAVLTSSYVEYEFVASSPYTVVANDCFNVQLTSGTETDNHSGSIYILMDCKDTSQSNADLVRFQDSGGWSTETAKSCYMKFYGSAT